MIYATKPIAYDALQAVSFETYKEFFEFLNISLPQGALCERQSYEYYYNDKRDFFPLWNSGVYFLKKQRQKVFYEEWKRIFLQAHKEFRDATWEFYIEQLAFAAAIINLELDVSIFPKGINFICTPRAPHLKDWPRERIIIEHYAGDTSQPLMFDGNRIDVVKSSILPAKD